jgi:hypothetical protein
MGDRERTNSRLAKTVGIARKATLREPNPPASSFAFINTAELRALSTAVGQWSTRANTATISSRTRQILRLLDLYFSCVFCPLGWWEKTDIRGPARAPTCGLVSVVGTTDRDTRCRRFRDPLIFMHPLRQKRILGVDLVSFICGHGQIKGTIIRSEMLWPPSGTPAFPASEFDGPAAVSEVLPGEWIFWGFFCDFLCFFLKRYFIRVIGEGD